MAKILFIAPHPPNVSPSQRFRFEHYLSFIKSQKIDYTYSSFINRKTWNILFEKGHVLSKFFGILQGYFRRVLLMASLHKFDFVFIHREVAPLGPPFFEWWIAKVARKKIIYDFDDAIWVRVASKSNPFSYFLKSSWKVGKICSWSWKISTGNEYLKAFASAYNTNTIKLPTVVDTEHRHKKLIVETQSDIVTIGWTGTFTNFFYLESVIPIIKKLQQSFNFRFLVIAGHDPLLTDIDYEFRKWSAETEISDLCQIDIGIMPLIDSDLAKGKCAFKAIQYMALGIPAVVSNIGANSEVVDEGINGFLCNSEQQWYQALSTLLNSEEIRLQFGKAARKKIEDHFSVNATQAQFTSLFYN